MAFDPSSGSEGSNDGEGKAKKRKRKATKGGGCGGNKGKTASGKRAVAAEGGRTPPRTPQLSEAKRAKEIDAGEQTVLSAEQLLRSLNSEKTFASVTVKGYNAVAGKVASRITPQLIAA